MKEYFKKLKILDIIILAVILAIIFISSFFIYSSSGEKLYLKIKTPTEEFLYPLNTNADIRIQGFLGITEIKIENNSAFIVSSACPNKICIAAEKLKKAGDWNACLPNRVFLTIENKN